MPAKKDEPAVEGEKAAEAEAQAKDPKAPTQAERLAFLEEVVATQFGINIEQAIAERKEREQALADQVQAQNEADEAAAAAAAEEGEE